MPDKAQKSQIITELKKRYFSMIQQLQANWTPEQHEKNRLSRSLAAFAIEKLADVAPAQAANAVVDGWGDNGIDAIYFDRSNNLLWLVQSKAGDAPDMGENKKFCDGIRDLQAGRFDKFNQTFVRLLPDVEEALYSEGLRIVGCNVHLGDGLGPHAIADLNQLATDLNKFTEVLSWQDIKLSVVHSWLSSEHTVAPPDVTLTLENWYGVRYPRRAYYGLVTAAQLADLYQLHKKALFEKNIRHYLGSLTVNSAIASTVGQRPAELFFLNNGITAICSQIIPSPGATNDQGVFTLRGFSVVNGAQTVGSISTVKSSVGTVSADAKLLITLIEVRNSTDVLGTEITRARNTQNEVKGLHFAALDPNQERLRREMAVSDVIYLYRPSEEARAGGPNIIEVGQATRALASFSGQTKIVVTVKKEIGLIFDRGGEYHPKLYKDNLSGVHLCRYVRIFEYLDSIFAASEAAETDWYRRMFYRHGRYFVLHIMARRHRSLLDKPEIVLSEADKMELSRVTLELAELIYTVAESMFNRMKGYLSVFRNLTDSEPLAKDVMKLLSEVDAQKAAAEIAQAGAANPLPAPPTTQPPPSAIENLPRSTDFPTTI